MIIMEQLKIQYILSQDNHFVIAQLREKRDKLGAKAIRIDSTADKPCLFPVLIIERT